MDAVDYPRFTPEEYGRRYGALRAGMAARGLDALVVWGSSNGTGEPSGSMDMANAFYLSNYLDPLYEYVVVPLDGDLCLVVSPENPSDAAQLWSVVDDVRPPLPDAPGQVAAVLRERGLATGRLGLVGGTRSQGLPPALHVAALHARLPQATWEDATDLMEELRCIKSEEEIVRLRRGGALSDIALEALQRSARPGVTDYEVRAAMLTAVLEAGGHLHIDFCGSTPMAEPDMPFPRMHKSERRLQAGDVILNEVSAGYYGYAGQIQRPFVVAATPTSRYLDAFRLAQEMLLRLEDGIRAGADAEVVWQVYDRFSQAGYTHFGPLTHGWGLNLEPPLFHRHTRGRPFTFSENMTLVLQPNPVLIGTQAGVFLGHLVRVTSSGVERLHRFPVEFMRVGG